MFNRLTTIIFSNLFLFIFALISSHNGYSQSESSQTIARTIIALYETVDGIDTMQSTHLHKYAQTPLNHLGLKLEYHNVKNPLPNLRDRADVRGVITWFTTSTAIKDPRKYLRWANDALRRDKKFVIIGETGFSTELGGKSTRISLINNFLSQLGIKDTSEWISRSYQSVEEYSDPAMMDFERTFDVNKPAFPVVLITKPDVTSHYSLRTRKNSTVVSHLVVTSPRGGYIAPGYAANINTGNDRAVQWYVNPFNYFKKAFRTSELPKPDTSTLAGRRIYFSHVDGDGWNSVSLIEDYRKKNILCSEVLLEEIIKKNPDLPVNISVVAADTALDWYGTEESRVVAKKIFRQAHVEAGSHTFTHPFQWGYFEKYDSKDEEQFRSKYKKQDQKMAKMDIQSWLATFLNEKPERPMVDSALHDNYQIPRAYAKEPFNLEQEIAGSFKEIEKLLPAGKKVKVLMWTGNTLPFEAALTLTREAGVLNINGGDTRFDDDFPSYLWVAPIGRQVGKELQIYAVNSNENTYTDLWFSKFHGFKYLPKTLENTEHPFRLRPINMYYHMYSAERVASLNALKSNIDYIKSQEICPIATSNYCTIAEGFFSTTFSKPSSDTWLVHSRKDLQTIRFDDAAQRTVNYHKSLGIVGHRHYQGSLYIYLDKSTKEARIALQQLGASDLLSRPYLVHSRWQIYSLETHPKTFSFTSQGFGPGEMEWAVPDNGPYEIIIDGNSQEIISVVNHRLTFSIAKNGLAGVQVKILKSTSK